GERMPRVLPRARIGLLSAAVLGATIRDALLAPATGAWFGLYAHTDVYTQAGAQAAVTTLEAALGRTADIDSWYEPWGDTFPTWRQPWDFANGRIPMISWGKEPVDTILSGADDAYIAARADGIKALGKTVFLRWFWEMDGNRNLAYSQSPEAYIAAWRHIHDVFTARGATNVAWVWCPNASSFTAGTAQPYYPGDDVVDWICADGYNFWPDSSYREFDTIFAGFYAWASQRPKPLMIGEYGDQQAAPGQRAAWIDAAHAALEEKFPRILAVVYFNSNSKHDWTMTAEPDALDAFRRMALDPYFNPPPLYPRP
ncbi:MAG TPA: glycosyl hydrolase, partial [Acidimicrobiia bacterium]|nr:glycosyl hydrolase [Acidimicrobiia bacterium]